ncbi:MAG: TetR/AcrR family transcriptional regulator [Taibaiella sp.]|nr:TetR/AcrR family transcriptional regulator [Taibaiella sp.]
MAGPEKSESKESTEAKIKEAARRVFTEKGYAATRTRDIAEASGYNLALINYYFRSKEKLFDLIMLEELQLFIHSIAQIADNRETSLIEKVELLASHYIEMLIANPGLPLFIMNEINRDPGKFVAKLGVDKRKSPPHIVIQWQAYTGDTNPANAMHLFINLISMTVFPFIAAPLLRNRTGMSTTQFFALMEERKKLIPMWVKQMIEESAQQGSTTANKPSRKKERK